VVSAEIQNASRPVERSAGAAAGRPTVAPDQVALHEAQYFMAIDKARVRMLSIGTATAG